MLRATRAAHAYPSAMGKKEPEQTDYQRAVRRWIGDLVTASGLSVNAFARKAGVSHTTVQRALDPDYAFDLKMRTLQKIAAATGSKLPAALDPDYGESFGPLPHRIDAFALGAFMVGLVGAAAGGDVARREERRLMALAETIAAHAAIDVGIVDDETRSILLVRSVAGVCAEPLLQPGAPADAHARLQSAVKRLPDILRALAKT